MGKVSKQWSHISSSAISLLYNLFSLVSTDIFIITNCVIYYYLLLNSWLLQVQFFFSRPGKSKGIFQLVESLVHHPRSYGILFYTGYNFCWMLLIMASLFRAQKVLYSHPGQVDFFAWEVKFLT